MNEFEEEKETEETLNNIPGSEDSISHDISPVEETPQILLETEDSQPELLEPTIKKETLLETDSIEMEIEQTEEETVDEKLARKLVEKQDFFDPTLELSKFVMPRR